MAWTQAQVSDFRRCYGRTTDADLCTMFGKSPSAVRALAERYCLRKDKAFLSQLDVVTKMPRWTKEEIEVLKELYPAHDSLEVARRLKRSVKSVASKAHELDLHKTPQWLSRMGRENRMRA